MTRPAQNYPRALAGIFDPGAAPQAPVREVERRAVHWTPAAHHSRAETSIEGAWVVSKQRRRRQRVIEWDAEIQGLTAAFNLLTAMLKLLRELVGAMRTFG